MYKIENREVLAAEFEAFLKGLRQTKYLWSEKTKGGGTEAYLAEDAQGRSYRVIVSSGKETENSISSEIKKDQQQKIHPDYGIDGPEAIRNLLISGAIILAISWFLFRLSGEWLKIAAIILIILGCFFAVCAAWIFIYAKVGKFRHRDRIIAMIPLKGNEQVLDIGTGRGLLMIGIAKKLTTGKSIGIDIWSQADLSANSYENAIKNAELEGVREKVEVKNMDAQNMTFADNSFDVIVSNLCIHNISKKAGRDKVCREIARVLKPGGMVLISDIKAKRYADELQKAGLKTSRCGIYFDLFPPIDIIKGVKNPQNLIR